MQWRISMKELESFAASFWERFKEKKVFAFHGQMGAGKTTVIVALCRQRAVHDPMGSPTFSIINEYSFNEEGLQNSIYHIDLYRLKDEEEVMQAGVEDCICSGHICMVEWPEKAPRLFDENSVHVFIETVSENDRIVRVGDGDF